MADINYFHSRLLTDGLDTFSMKEKNDFILAIAQERGLVLTDITPDYLLNYHKTLKIQQFSSICETTIMNGFESASTGNTYRTDRDDQLNFLAKYVIVKEDETVETVYWKAENLGKLIPHTRDEFFAVVKEGFHHKETLLYKLDVLRSRIRAAATDADIAAVKWDDPL